MCFRQKDASTLPILAWQLVIIQVSENERVLDPVLACARDQTVQFFQVMNQNEASSFSEGSRTLTAPLPDLFILGYLHV